MPLPRADEIQDWAHRYGAGDVRLIYAYAAKYGALPPVDATSLGLFHQAITNLAHARAVSEATIEGYYAATGGEPTSDEAVRQFQFGYGGVDAAGHATGVEPPLGWHYVGGDPAGPTSGISAPAPIGGAGPVLGTAPIGGGLGGLVGQVTGFVQRQPLLAGGIAIGAFVLLGGGGHRRRGLF